MLDANFYKQEADLKRKQDIDSLVSEGLLTPEQATSALGARPEPAPTIDTPQFEAPAPEPTPSPEERMQAMDQDTEQIYRQAYGARQPTLQETLHAYSQNPAFSLAERKNLSEAVSKVTLDHNAAASSLGSDALQRVATRVAKNNSIDVALGAKYNRYVRMGVGLGQEFADTANRLDSHFRSGWGLPGMKEHWDRDKAKYGPLAVLSIPAGIAVGTVTGFIEAIPAIAKGDADLEQSLHFLSMLAIPFTMGASAVGAGAKAAHAGMTMGNAARMGRVMASFNKLPNWVKKASAHPPGTWGGLNIGKWKEMGTLTRTSTAAELAEYATNPEEWWYELIGDASIQGATRMFGGGSEWTRDQLTNPEKQMRAQERGFEKRMKRISKMDAGVAKAFQEIYTNLEESVGTDVSEARVEALDNLLAKTHEWENTTKFNWITQQYKGGETEQEIATDQAVQGYKEADAEQTVVEQEAVQTSSEPPEAHTPSTLSNYTSSFQELVNEISDELTAQNAQTSSEYGSITGQIMKKWDETGTPVDDLPEFGPGDDYFLNILDSEVNKEMQRRGQTVPEESPPPTEEVPVPVEGEGETEEAQPTPVDDTPTETPETQQVTNYNDILEGETVESMDLGEIENVNSQALEQGNEAANQVVREEVDKKANQVFEQGAPVSRCFGCTRKPPKMRQMI